MSGKLNDMMATVKKPWKAPKDIKKQLEAFKKKYEPKKVRTYRENGVTIHVYEPR